ncbi:hypothetical protein PD653_4558 [Nocardioides sp. PD653]|nr:hypothetical protein PD653B2_4818 [Nocardioides sp. PD653-B2]GAW57116.1 hypothetical protein PD653_4558 [Nocardioides sp. PD653]
MSPDRSHAAQRPDVRIAPIRAHARVRANIFECTSQKDHRKKLKPWEVFVHPDGVLIDVTFDNFSANADFDDPTGYIYYQVTGDISWGIHLELKLGVHCELAPDARKSLTLFDQKIGQVGPVPIRLAVRPVFEFDAGAKGSFEVKQTRHLVGTIEKRADESPTFDMSFDPTSSVVDVDAGLEASVTAGLELELFGGVGSTGKRVGLGVALAVGIKFAVEPERGCAEIFATIPVSLTVRLDLWRTEWKLVKLSHDFGRAILERLCFTKPSIKPSLPAATLGVSYDQRLQTKDNRSGRWAVSDASLPPGLTLDPDTGRLFGVPTGNAGTRVLQVSFTDVAKQTTTSAVSLPVLGTPDIVARLLGNIARQADGKAWYVDLRGGRHSIPDGGTYECLVAQGAVPVEVSPTDVSTLPLTENAACVRAAIGDIIRTRDGDAYLLDAGWVRRWIPDGNSYDCLRLNGHAVVNAVPRYYVMDHTSGPDATLDCASRDAAKGHVVKADDGSSWYIDLRGTAHWIPDGGTYDCITQQGRSLHPYVIPRRLLGNFGDPKEYAACVRASPGSIIRTKDSDAYLIQPDWTRSWIPDGRTYQCLEANDHALVDNVPRYYLMDLTQGPNVSLNCYDAAAVKGKAVRASDGSSFYIDKRGGKHWIPDGGTFECVAAQTGGAWPYRVPVAWLTQERYEEAQCVRANPGDIIRHSDGDAYLINGDWSRGWIPDAASYACWRAEQRAVVHNVPRYYVDDLVQVGNASYPSGHCLVRRPNGSAYFVNNEGNKEWVPDTPTWDCEVGRGVPVVNSTDGIVDSITEVGWHYCLNKANLRGKLLRHTDGDVSYIHGDDTRTWVPDEFTYNCRTNAGVQVVETRWREYVNAFADAGWDYCFDINTFKNRYIRHPDGDIYFVDDRGVRHWVPTASTQNCLNGRYGAPATVRWREYINRLPQGDWAVCGDTLYRNQNLDVGQWLRSSNGAYTLVMQSDANLVLYHGSRAIWASGTNGRPVHHLKLHDNGCMALIDSSGNWLWRPSPDPCNKGGDHLAVQNDGNLVLYAGSRAVWASNTSGR